MSIGGAGGVNRRTFLQGASAWGAGAFLLPHARAREATNDFPKRTFGRTQAQVTTLALGTWPCGRSSDLDVSGVATLVREALALGINFVDTAGAYGKAEEAIGVALEGQRDRVFLATKVWANTARDAEQSLTNSLRKLHTEQLDLVYLHSVGDRDVPQVMAPDGALDFLVRQKERGTLRFIGISGHSRPEQFVQLIQTGQIDALMVAMNFVDVHTYGFEHKVLPVAREYGLGIACMKVLGGMRGGFRVADGPNPGPMIPAHLKELAVRYALGLDQVATLVIGPHTVEQLRENARLVQAYEPLSETEREGLLAHGRELAPQWGPHYGPVA